jgi:hypothetical protein
MVALVLLRLKEVTAIAWTVTVQVAVFVLPSVFVMVTLMVAVPPALPVTVPELLTVATLVLLLDQLILWYPAPEGLTVALRVTEPFTLTEAVAGRLTPVTVVDCTKMVNSR